MIIRITPNDKGNPPGKLADAELHRRVLKHSLDERIHGVIQDERLPVPTRLARTTPTRNGKATSRRAAS